mmetsp:Transcript_8545/g.20278  ORF Transcript_8545/g.20278 Transcript_8545/m.20278 type:complete len:309 (+) Transcript_8545:318-1244(+)
MSQALELAAAPIHVEHHRRLWVPLLHSGNHLLHVVQAVHLKLLRGQVVRPRVKELDDLGAALDLVVEVFDEGVREVVEERVQDGRLVEHHGLGLLAVPVSAALHRVGREGPGGADEADDRRLVRDLLAERAENLLHEREVLVRAEHGPERHDVVHALDGVRDDGTLALDDVEVDAERGQRGEDVAEHDDAVRLVGAEGLEGERDGDVGGLRALPEGEDVRILSEFLHVPPRLPQEPRRSALALLTPRHAQQQRVLPALRGAAPPAAPLSLLPARLGRAADARPRRADLRRLKHHRRTKTRERITTAAI